MLQEGAQQALVQPQLVAFSFHPVVEEFRTMIENDPEMMYFTLIFEQQAHFPPHPGSGDIKLKNYGRSLFLRDYR